MTERLPYFSERHGRGPLLEPLPFDEFRALVVSALDSLRLRGLFQESFGAECVDGDSDGTRGDPAAFIFRSIRRRHVWPYWAQTFWENGLQYEGDQAADQWDPDTTFDVIELLHDEASKPQGGRVHGFNDCPCIRNVAWYNKQVGQAEYIAEMNEVLSHHDPPYEMNGDGRLIERTPDEFRPLMAAAIPTTPESHSVEVKIEHAKAVFTARGATIESKREAVRSLADCLERLRPTIKKSMLSSDEDALFMLANKFSVRHLNREQRSDYDPAIWLRWMFYVNLATVHAVLRVRANQIAGQIG